MSWITPHSAVVLVIIIPLLASLLSFSFYKSKFSALLNILSAAATNYAAYTIFDDVFFKTKGTISYNVGGWASGLGIELSASPISTVLVVMIQIAYLCASLFTYPNRTCNGGVTHLPSFCTLLSLFAVGMTGMSLSNDAFNIFVFLEVASISGYSLVAMGRGSRSALAAFDYLVVGAVGASFYLLGVGILYLDTGLLNISLVRLASKNLEAATLASVFIMTGLSIKAAIFPLHVWLVKSYKQAPPCFTMLSGAVFTKVIVLTMLKMFTGISWHEGLMFSPEKVMLTAGLVSMLFGAAWACMQRDWRSIVASSSISQVGYIITGFALGSFKSVESAIITTTTHTLVQMSLFAVAGLALYTSRNDDDLNLPVAFKGNTLAMACVIILLCSVVGVPGTAGFIAKFFILEFSVSNGMWLVASCVMISSALAVIYCLRLVEQIINPPSRQENGGNALCVPSACLVSTMLTLSSVAIIYIGLYPRAAATIARSALTVMR